MVRVNAIPRFAPQVNSRGVGKGIRFGIVISMFVLPILLLLAPSASSSPQKVVVVIDDDPNWGSLIAIKLRPLGFKVIPCVTFCDHPAAVLFVVDAQDAADLVVGPEFVRQLRLNHPNSFIVGMSGRLDVAIPGQAELLRAQFLVAGANTVWDKGNPFSDLLSLLPKE